MANCIRCGRKLPPMSFKKICQWCVHHEAVQRGEDSNAPQPVMAAPWVRRGESSISLTQIFFGASVAVFIAMVLASGPSLDFTGQVKIHFGANYGPVTLSGQWWRLVTYMFLHGGLLHIAFNMWCLWDLGALAESLYGRWTFGAIYLITGIGGGLASIAWNPSVRRVGRDLRTGWRVDRIVLSRRILPAQDRDRRHPQKSLDICGLQPFLWRRGRRHRQCLPHRWAGQRPHPGSADRAPRSRS